MSAVQVLAVERAAVRDAEDQAWLDERINSARDGIEAVIDIALNWTVGRNVSRLHPHTSANAYVREHVGILGPKAISPLLKESNWSNRQIAAIAGVSEVTVRRTASNGAVERPTKTLGADGKLRPVRINVLKEPSPKHPRTDEYKALMTALRAVVELKPTLRSVYEGVNDTQHQRLQKLAREVGKIIEDILIPMDFLVIE